MIKISKTCFTVIFFLSLFVTDLLPVNAYVSVDGYYKKNGTYVQPYVRSEPNGLKSDNYGYKPSQGLYNDSYGTKGTAWDTPTYITDPNYYTGLNLYNTKQAPSYTPLPTYTAPTYTTPSYTPPTFKLPTYTAPTYTAPILKVPTYTLPTYNTPTYTPFVAPTATPKTSNIPYIPIPFVAPSQNSKINEPSKSYPPSKGQIVSDACDGIPTDQYPDLFTRGLELTSQCTQQICLNGCKVNGVLLDEITFNNMLKKCSQEGPEKAEKEILSICSKIQQSKTTSSIKSCSSFGSGSYLWTDNNCYCSTGYSWNSSRTQCVPVASCEDGILRNNQCLTPTQDCELAYGKNIAGVKATNGGSTCSCNQGYYWNNTKKTCDLSMLSGDEIIALEKSSTGKIDIKTINKFKGKILTEKINSQVVYWYVNPIDSKRYILNSSSNLLTIISKTALSANTSMMTKVLKSPKTFSGRFVIDFQAGRHYYINPNDQKMYDVAPKSTDGHNRDQYDLGFQTIKTLSVAIDTQEIRKINVGDSNINVSNVPTKGSTVSIKQSSLSCNADSVLNPEINKCITKLSLDLVCQKEHGSFGIFDGTFTKGKANCSCIPKYSFNPNNTEKICVTSWMY